MQGPSAAAMRTADQLIDLGDKLSTCPMIDIARRIDHETRLPELIALANAVIAHLRNGCPDEGDPSRYMRTEEAALYRQARHALGLGK